MNALANCLAAINLLSSLAVALTTALVGMLGTFSTQLDNHYYPDDIRGDSSKHPTYALQGVLSILCGTIWISLVGATPFLGSNIIEVAVFGLVGFFVGVQLAEGLWKLGKSRIFRIQATPFDLFDDTSTETDRFGSGSTP